MKRTLGIVIKSVIFSLIPAVAVVLGSSTVVADLQSAGYLGQAVDVGNIKNICTVSGAVLTFFLLTLNLAIHEIEEEKYKERSRQLIAYNKNILVSALSEYIGRDYCNIDIRIFVPRKTICWRIGRIFKKDVTLTFCIKNIEGLADAGITNNLKFQVEPKNKVQGLVGECYQQRKIIYDDNLVETNSTYYNLTECQMQKTNDLKFILVCPVFGHENDVDAIVAFDCKHELKIDDQNDKFINAVLNYTQQLHEHVPDLFKSKGGFY